MNLPFYGFIAAPLRRWLEGAEEEYQERIPVFSVITRAAGIRTRESP
jgi:hypothetical protein